MMFLGDDAAFAQGQQILLLGLGHWQFGIITVRDGSFQRCGLASLAGSHKLECVKVILVKGVLEKHHLLLTLDEIQTLDAEPVHAPSLQVCLGISNGRRSQALEVKDLAVFQRNDHIRTCSPGHSKNIIPATWSVDGCDLLGVPYGGMHGVTLHLGVTSLQVLVGNGLEVVNVVDSMHQSCCQVLVAVLSRTTVRKYDDVLNTLREG